MSLELVIKENTEVMRQLIAAMQGGKTFTPDAPPQPKTDSASVKKEERKGPFYWKSLDGQAVGVEQDIASLTSIVDADAGIEITKVEYLQFQEKQTKAERPDLDTLEFSDIIALACFYPDPGVTYSADMFQRAIDYRDAEGDKRVVQIDALDSALRGVKRALHLSKPALMDLSRNIIRYWDDLPTIADRRNFAERLLDAPAAGRHEVKPKKAQKETKAAEPEQDTAALFEQARTLVMKLTTGGYRNEAVEILNKFGAQKLGQVPQENLADVVMLAEQALAEG